MSERGSVTIDERTNTLLLNDTADKLEEVRRLINKLDIPVRQVLIESRIVIANDDFSRDLGVRFGATGVKSNGSSGIIGTSGSLQGTDTMVSSAPLPVNMPALNNRLNVNLPVASPTGQIALAVLGSDYLVDLELSAMQAEGRGEVVSSPRVITSNQSEAFIKQGVEIPYLEASSSGAATVSFKEAVLSLKVTPQITPDDLIGYGMIPELVGRMPVITALTALDEGRDAAEIAKLASLAKTKVGETFHTVSREGIQMHGGIGMTDEFDIGFFIKRAAITEQTFGDVNFHRNRYGELEGY